MPALHGFWRSPPHGSVVDVVVDVLVVVVVVIVVVVDVVVVVVVLVVDVVVLVVSAFSKAVSSSESRAGSVVYPSSDSLNHSMSAFAVFWLTFVTINVAAEHAIMLVNMISVAIRFFRENVFSVKFVVFLFRCVFLLFLKRDFWFFIFRLRVCGFTDAGFVFVLDVLLTTISYKYLSL